MEGDHPSFTALAALAKELHESSGGPSSDELAEAFDHAYPQNSCGHCQAVLLELRSVYEKYIANS